MEPDDTGGTPAPEPAAPRHPRPSRRGGAGGLFLILVFGFGAAAGLLLAFVGAGLIEESGALILTVFLSALVVVGVLGGLVFILGTLVAAWPDRETAGVRARVPARAGVARA